MPDQDVNIKVKAKDEASGVFDKIAMKAKALQKERRTSGESALAKGLKSGGSLTDLGLDALGIGLPAMIADRIGQGLAAATGKVAEFRDSMREGGADWKGMVVSGLEALPIVGGFATAGKNIREAITGEKAAIDQLNRATEANLASWDAMEAVHKRIKEIDLSWAHLARDISNQEKLIGLKGAMRAELEAEIGAEKQLDSIEDKRKKDKESLSDDPALKAARDKLAEAKRMSEAGEEGDFEQANLNYQKLSREVTAKKKEIDVQADRALEATRRSLAKDKEEIERQEHERQLKDERDFQIEMFNIHRDAEGRAAAQEAGILVSSLNYFGHSQDAELAQLNASYEAKKRATEKFYVEQHARLESEAQKADSIGDHGHAMQLRIEETNFLPGRQVQENSKSQEQYEIDKGALEKKYARHSADLQQEARDAEADADGEAHERKLRDAGRAGEAQLSLLKRLETEKEAEIDRNAKRAAEDDPDNAKAILAKAAADKKKLQADSAENVNKAEETDIKNKADVASKLAKGRISLLQEEAKYGNISAAKEAQKLKIQQDYNDKRAELNELLKNESATAEQKQQAKDQLSALDKGEKRELSYAGIRSSFALPGGGEAGRGITGAQAVAREQNNPMRALVIAQQKKDAAAKAAQEKAEQQREQLINQMKRVADAMTKHPEMQDIFGLA